MKKLTISASMMTATLLLFTLTTENNTVQAEDTSTGAGVTKRCNNEFSLLDGNKNGVLESQEIHAGIETEFKKIDLDNDGKITMNDVLMPDLYPQIRDDMSKKNFHELVPEDVNRDGKVTLAEYQNYNDSELAKETGWDIAVGITLDKYCSYVEQPCYSKFSQLDKNGNGIFEGEELENVLKAAFEEKDRNKDGRLTMEDVLLPEMHQKIRDDISKKPFHKLVAEDVNKDGEVTFVEYQNYAAGRIKDEIGWNEGAGLTRKAYCDYRASTRGQK